MEKEQSPRRFNIDDVVAFGELDSQTVVERADSKLGPGNYLVKTSSGKARAVTKDREGNFKVVGAELLMVPEKSMKVVGFLTQ